MDYRASAPTIKVLALATVEMLGMVGARDKSSKCGEAALETLSQDEVEEEAITHHQSTMAEPRLPSQVYRLYHSPLHLLV